MVVDILSNDCNKRFYEDLCIQENRVDGGWSNDFGYISESDIEEFTLIQKYIIQTYNVQCTLMSAEYYWSEYCQLLYHATWIKPNPAGFDDFNVFLQKNWVLV